MLYPFSLTLDLYIDERCPNGVAEDLMYNTEK